MAECWQETTPAVALPTRYPAGRRCPTCRCFLATDNEGPLCSPCERTVVTAEILAAIAAAEATPPRAPRLEQPSLEVQVDALLRVLAGGPKTTLELDAALHLSGASRPARWKQLQRVIAEAERQGHRVAFDRRRGYRLRARKTRHMEGTT